MSKMIAIIVLIRDRPYNTSAVRGRLSSVDILRTMGEGGYSEADVRTFWRKELRIFWNLWCIRTDKGIEPVRIFCGQGRGGSIFLCGRLLWTAPNNFSKIAKRWELSSAP